MRGDNQNRPPVSTYSDALAWLFTHSNVEDQAFDPEQDLPREAKLVCDMFWIKEADLIRDLRKTWNEALGPTTAAPLRRHRNAGWR